MSHQRVPVNSLSIGSSFAIISPEGGVGDSFAVVYQNGKIRYMRLWDTTYADEYFTSDNKEVLVIHITRQTADYLAQKSRNAMQKPASSDHWISHKRTTFHMFFDPDKKKRDKEKSEFDTSYTDKDKEHKDKDGLSKEKRAQIEEIKQNKSQSLDFDDREIWE